MTASIHGHDVLRFMLGQQTGFTRETLVSAIEDRFGVEAHFHTCSAEDMDAGALVEFLAERGKFVPAREGGFTTTQERMCDHD